MLKNFTPLIYTAFLMYVASLALPTILQEVKVFCLTQLITTYLDFPEIALFAFCYPTTLIPQ